LLPFNDIPLFKECYIGFLTVLYRKFLFFNLPQHVLNRKLTDF
jgi:hypothetical protein